MGVVMGDRDQVGQAGVSDYAKRCDRCGYVYAPSRLRILGGFPVRYRCRDVVRCNKNIARREAYIREKATWSR